MNLNDKPHLILLNEVYLNQGSSGISLSVLFRVFKYQLRNAVNVSHNCSSKLYHTLNVNSFRVSNKHTAKITATLRMPIMWSEKEMLNEFYGRASIQTGGIQRAQIND